MAQEVQSIWSSIKKYEDILVKDPKSYCFAQLSELYRKLGLLDDAIFVANRGLEIHPDYVGGHLALGKAFFDKGLRAKSRFELEEVIKVAPENFIALKLLGLIYLEMKETDRADQVLTKVLELHPEDVECRIALESLSRNVESAVAASLHEESEEDLEEAEIVEDDDLLADDWLEEVSAPTSEVGAETGTIPDLFAGLPGADALSFGVPSPPSPIPSPGPSPSPGRDPLSTATLAEIYLAQGFLDQALKIFRELLKDEPDNADVQRRIAEIEAQKARSFTSGMEPAAPAAPDSGSSQGAGDQRALSELEEWLENIKRSRE